MRLRLLATAAAATLLTLTACSSTDSGTKPPETSDTPSATQTTTGTLLDEIPDEAPVRPEDIRSNDGSIAFATYVAEVAFYTIVASDPTVLMKISDSEICATCKRVRAGVEENVGKNQAEVLRGSVVVSNAKVTATEGGFYTVKESVFLPAGGRIDSKTGKVLEKYDEETQKLNVDMQWRKGSWVLLEYDVLENE